MRFAMITLAAALFAGAAATPADAQERGQRRPGMRAERMDSMKRMDPAQRVDRRVEMMTKRLDLSAEQATRIRAILLQQAEQLEQMKAAHTRTESAINDVLNADQRRKLEEAKERGGERKRGARRARPVRS